MTNRIAFILTLSFSFLFGVDTPKEIETSSQIITEIQFDADAFQQNQLIKKGMIENYKQARRAKGIPKPDGKPVHISRKKGSGPSGKHFQKLESIKADLNPKNFFGDFNSRSAHKKETAKVDYLTRRDEMKQKRAFAPKKQNSMIPHGNDMSSYPTGYRTHQTENNGRPTIQNIRNRETISFFDYHDVHAYVSNWLTTNATFVLETEAGPEAGEDALQWVEGGETGASRSKVGWSFNPHIDLSSVWDSVSVSDHWFRIEIKTDYSGNLSVYFGDGPGKYQVIPVTTMGTGLWETYEFPLSDTSPTTGANATDFNTSDISALSIQDFNHQEGRTFYIGVIEIYSPADDENGMIEGMVFDNNGNPLSGASVTAYNANENISVMTNETGYYNMSVTDTSTYRVYASSENFWDADIYPVTVGAGDIVILDFTLMPEADYAWIIGLVQDDMGNLVSEAVVTITGIDGVDVFSQPSDWSGTFYTVVAPGTYNIHVDSDELLSGDITLEAEAGMVYYPVVELVFSDEDPGWLITHVFDLDGNPLEGAEVGVWNDEFYANTMTDEGGHTIMEIPPGWYEVDAHADGFEPGNGGSVEILSNEETFMDFWLEPDNGGGDDYTYLGEFNGHEYYVSNFDATWNIANDYSSDFDDEAHLVTISSQEENDFVLEHTGGGIWIGFTDQYVEGNWEWVTGEDVVYTNWDEGEPNNDGEQHWATMLDWGEWDDLQNIPMRFVYEIGETQDFELTNFEITINGGNVADIEAGESATVTIEFEDTGAEPYAGMLAIFYDANFNDVLDPGEDINFFEEDGEGPAVLLLDNVEPDENPEVGIIEFTLGPDMEDGPGFLTMFQYSSWFFTSYDPEYDEFGGSTATLNVTGFESGYSISGNTEPPTPNMMVYTIIDDNMEQFPHLTFTQNDGSYHVDVAQAGPYIIGMDDGLEIYGNLYASPSFQFVEVLGDESRINFEIVEYDAMVYGHVTNPEGEGIWDAEVNFSYHEDDENVHIESDAWTDDDGYYELWLQSGYEYDVNVWADGFNEYYSSVYVDDSEELEFNVILNFGGNEDYGWIEGYVQDMNGWGIPYADVYAWNYDYMYAVTTDENGNFSMEVPAGYYDMEAWAPGYSSEMNWVEVYPNESSWVEFWLNQEDDYNTLVHGHVHDVDGNPLSFANVNANYLYDEWESEGTFTNEDGYYELYLRDDAYRITAGAEGFWVSAYDTIYVGGDSLWLDFELSPVGEFDGGWQGNVNLVGNYDPELIYLAIMSPDYQVFRILYEPGPQEVELVNGSYHLIAGADGYQEVFIPNAINIENNVVNFDINLIQEGLLLPPQIEFAGDVPNDQGRQMRLVWNPGVPGDWGYFEFFSIWRQVNEAPMILWDFIDVVPWHGMEAYSAVVPTLGDSTDMGIYWSTFRVTGHTENPNEFYDSAPVSGYSIDNLHPGAPGGVQAFTGGEGILLTWDSSMDEDFGYHRIYRHDTDSGDPAIEFTTVDTFYVDDVAEGNYEYWIIAVDLNGNESDPSIIVTVTLAIDNGLAVPMEFALQQNYPNPFNPSTQIQYALPTDANVTIAIYDLVGRQIRTLVNEQVTAGYHSTLWNATNDMGSPVSAGVYIYTITANDFRDVKKMILLK